MRALDTARDHQNLETSNMPDFRPYFKIVSPLDRPPRGWYYRCAMNDSRPESTNLMTRASRDKAPDAALERLAPRRGPDRPDSPDLHVTAVRRLPAVAALFAPFPEAIDPRLRSALES